MTSEPPDSIHRLVLRGMLRDPRGGLSTVAGLGLILFGLVTFNPVLMLFGSVVSALFVAIGYAFALMHQRRISRGG